MSIVKHTHIHVLLHTQMKAKKSPKRKGYSSTVITDMINKIFIISKNILHKDSNFPLLHYLYNT